MVRDARGTPGPNQRRCRTVFATREALRARRSLPAFGRPCEKKLTPSSAAKRHSQENGRARGRILPMTELRAASSAHIPFDVNRNGRSTLTSDARYRLLLEVFHSTRGTLDLHETLDRLLDALQLLVPFDAAGIFVLRDEVAPPRMGGLVEQIAGVSWRGFPPRSPLTDPMLRDGKGIVGHVIRTGEVVCAADVRLDPRYIEGREATRSEVAVPTQLDARTSAAFNLKSDTPAAFRTKDGPCCTSD